MLFNSVPFLFLFLPVTLGLYLLAGRRNHRLAALWLVLASLFFYGWWNPRYLLLLCLSIAGNFTCGIGIANAARDGRTKSSGRLLALGVAANLALLAYYKYANFFLDTLNTLNDTGWRLDSIVLPLGISFFTFTQIAFLVDCRRGIAADRNVLSYALFVTYFPHLIAGPVLHHKEMMPQFSRPATYIASAENLAVGVTMFSIGLFKKIILADGIAPYASAVFGAAADGRSLSLVEANTGALAYAFQLYFDFSGYSDMAVGLSRMFGVTLPANFASPYKATSIIEFWRRWHITLSRFLRDYLYIPLGGNRRGGFRRHLNLWATMLLGGLWHGASWNFVAWGGIHGAMLAINHGWQSLRQRLAIGPAQPAWLGRAVSVALTFYLVSLAWIFFRADNLTTAWNMLLGAVGANGIVLPESWRGTLGPLADVLGWNPALFAPMNDFVIRPPINWFAWLFGIIWLLPNSQQLLARFNPVSGPIDANATPRWLAWKPSAGWALLVATLLLVSVLRMNRVSEFLYFQF